MLSQKPDATMSDTANERMSAEEFNERFGGRPTGQARVEVGETYEKIVAVDPGTDTGVAAYWGDLLKTFTLSFWEVYQRARKEGGGVDSTLYIVEAPYKTGVTHQRLISGRQKLSAQLKIAQNAGGVQREAELLVEGLKRWGYDVVEHEPSTSKKWSDKKLRRLIGEWEGPSNEHTRDAIMMLVAHGLLP